MKENVKNRSESETRETTCSFGHDYDTQSPSGSDHNQPSLHSIAVCKASENDACGFLLTRNKWDPYPWISSVEANSPADSGGLKAGDCLLEVNGEDMLGRRVANIADLVRNSQGQVRLLVWRNSPAANCNSESICCGPLPRSLERLAALAHSMLAIIECPVCLNTIEPPAMQCQNGHLICVECRIRAITCPVCRDRYTPHPSLLAEQIHAAFSTAFSAVPSHNGDEKMRTKIFGPTARPSKRHIETPQPAAAKQRLFRKLLRPQRRYQKASEVDRSDPAEVASGGNSPLRHRGTSSFLKNSFNRLRKSISMGNLAAVDNTSEAAMAATNPMRLPGVAEEQQSGRPSKHFSLSVNDLTMKAGKNDDDRPSCSTSVSSSISATAINLQKLTTTRPRRDIRRVNGEPVDSASPSDSSTTSSQRLGNPVSNHLNAVRRIERRDMYQFTGNSCLNNEFISMANAAACSGKAPVGPASRPASTSSSSSFEFVASDEKIAARFRCPFDCGRRFGDSAHLQRHVKEIHQKPILSFARPCGAMVSLPLSRPLDDAVLIVEVAADESIKNDDKAPGLSAEAVESSAAASPECWIRIEMDGRGVLLAGLMLADSDESVDFVMETRLLSLNANDKLATLRNATSHRPARNGGGEFQINGHADQSDPVALVGQDADDDSVIESPPSRVGHNGQDDGGGSVVVTTTSVPLMTDATWLKAFQLYASKSSNNAKDGDAAKRNIDEGNAVNTHGSNTQDDGFIYYGPQPGQPDDTNLMTGDFLLNINVQQKRRRDN